MWQILNRCQLTIAIEKTHIGKISHGFTFLGYSFTIDQFTIANQTILKHPLNRNRIFEHGASPTALAAFQKNFNFGAPLESG
ncbi:MAG: hypothetical protein E6Q33_06355 [Neisseriales bacterium]|nr:MAG: hypothetical protein E6Q33_06355 [Neisseriales bacterium]